LAIGNKERSEGNKERNKVKIKYSGKRGIIMTEEKRRQKERKS
jgi:hypothetical protein